MPRSHTRTMDNLRLQRRHYQFISDVIRDYYEHADTTAMTIGDYFAVALKGTNAGYDQGRFVAACGDAPTSTPKCLLCQSEASHD
jgi:hypothetical protein